MTFTIDTGDTSIAPIPKSAEVDTTQQIDPTNGLWMERAHRQIIEAIECCETASDLADYMEGESLLLDSLYMNWPEYWARIDEAHEMQRSILTRANPSAQADPIPAEPGIPTPQNGQIDKGNTMNAFSNFDTGGGGSEGPWLQWSARGTLDGEISAKSFLIRDDSGKRAFAGFTENGVILDIETMQTGWCYSSGTAGEAPTWKMNPDITSFMPQPGDEYKKGFKMRVAIGGGQTASWDQSGAAAWNCILGLIPQFQQQPAPGKLPLVTLTDTKLEQFKRGSTVTPILTVQNWVDRPDCLKEGAAAGIDGGPSETAGAATPAPAPENTPTPSGASF